AAQGRPLDAARLWGAADRLRERTGAALTPEEKAVEERFVPVVTALLGDEVFQQTRAEMQSRDTAVLESIASELGTAALSE
ncbi:MAG TPA: hypothetical protein VI540_00230, partial [Gaiellaceae bacterium]|nr:hypothetical protein [Gaiellaceae bacterium]